ncbi:MAG TPA: carboxypeptidase regulatory-like domain-containing protein [Bryobacteraceae bacterium]|nr:carboxypeptidase regulatory-like domain-containing protein [Bryobacteraceae bacterium]
MQFTRCFARLCCFIALSTAAWAQAVSTAQIQGTVQDATGAAVAGAEVKATQTDTGISRTTTTGADGGYVLSNLPIGPYSLEVSKQGFSRYVQTGIVLQVAASPTIDIALKVGEVSEQISVQADAALVETQSTGVGNVMESQRILDLPLNGRNPADLIQLAGAAVAPGAAFNASSRSFQGEAGGEGYAVAGGQTSGTTYMLDGALHNNPFDGLNLPLPFPDALQEFKLETSALTAQNGIHSGAAVTAVTKSGTNEYHGDLFEFVRNNVFNATNPFAAVQNGQRLTDGLKRNQFGGTIGGPIEKNKLFFFGGFQETLTRQQPASNLSFIPTAAILQGNWSAFTSPACNGNRQINLGAPFVNNQIAPALYDPAAVKIAELLPQTSSPCGAYSFVQPLHDNEYQLVGKVDFQQSSKNSLFGRYIRTTYQQTPPYELEKDLLATTVGGRDNLAQTFTLGDTYLIGANMVNSFRAAVNRTGIHRTNAPFLSPNDVGINVFDYVPEDLILSVTGGFSIGSGIEIESRYATTTYELSDDVTWVKGSHQFAFGGYGSFFVSNSYANVRSSPNFSFSGIATGLGMADFMTGKLTLLDQATPNTVFVRQWFLGLYGQDTWKVSRRLTLNLGLRWEPWFPTAAANGAIYNFSLDRYNAGIVSQVYPNAPPGLYFAGDPGFPGLSGQYKKFKDFEPRIGLSWDPTGSGKTSIRASYGLFYDFANSQIWFNTTVAPPFGDEIKNNSPAGGFDNPWLGFPGGNPYPITSHDLFTPHAPYITVAGYNMPTTEMHSWNLSVQRQIFSNWVASVSYVGNETEHLWDSTQLNPPVFLGTGPCTLAGVFYPTCSTAANYDQRRVLSLANPVKSADLGYVDIYDPGGTQSYNGLVLSLQHRFAKGMTMNANYTWSHCIGDAYVGNTTPNPGTGYQIPSDRRADRGNCVFDRRGNLNVSGAYEMPRFNSHVANMLASHWRISPIFRYLTGAPMTITTGVDRALDDNTATQRPNQIAPNVYAGGFLNYLNPAAFSQPAIGSLGNMGTYNVFGPGLFEVDAALSRLFTVRERKTLEVRAEAYNLPNFFLRGNPTTTLSSNTFGQITQVFNTGYATSGGGGPRVLQFAAKFNF